MPLQRLQRVAGDKQRRGEYMIRLLIILLLIATKASAFDLGMSFDLGGGSSVRYADIISTLSWNPTSKAFGDVNTGSTSDQEFTLLCAAGGGDCEEITTSATGTGFTINSTTCATAPFTLTAGSNCTATTRFAPTVAGAHSGSLVAAWTNRDDVTASLSGTGVSGDPYTTYFNDDFNRADSGDVKSTIWTTETDTGSLGAIASNAYAITYSSANTASYVEKTGLTAYGDTSLRYKIKFSTATIFAAGTGKYFNSGSILSSTNSGFGIRFKANSSGTVAYLVISYNNGVNTVIYSADIAYTFADNTSYDIRLDAKFSTNTTSNDGSYSIKVNGTEIGAVTGISTYVASGTKVSLGPSYVNGTLTGTINFDDFTVGYK